jgi:hypothetical protein
MMFVLWPEVAISYIMGSVCKPIILSVIKGKKENVLDVKAMEEQRGGGECNGKNYISKSDLTLRGFISSPATSCSFVSIGFLV